MKDLNCKEVSWENWSREGTEPSWRDQVLELVIDNFLTPWVEENTRLRGSNKPSKLDLIITSYLDIIKEMNNKNPVGKSNQVLIEQFMRR